MCQVSKTKKLIKLEEDLIVYKTINKDLYSTYRAFKYKLGKLYSMSRFKILLFRRKENNQYYFNNGFHSYPNKMYPSFNYIMVECTIPKGSYIIRGKFSMDDSIVSNKIIINKILR